MPYGENTGVRYALFRHQLVLRAVSSVLMNQQCSLSSLLMGTPRERKGVHPSVCESALASAEVKSVVCREAVEKMEKWLNFWIHGTLAD